MTHEPETDIEDAVLAWFVGTFGVENVDQQVYLPEPRWFCDIVVEVGFGRLYIEVENDANSVRPGIGQALAYAGTDPAGIPLVITPKDHLDPDRREILQQRMGVLVREFDTEAMEFVSGATR